MNELTKEALSKYEKEKDQKNSEDSLKKEQKEKQVFSERNIERIPNLINPDAIKEINGKNQNDYFYKKKICSKRKIVLIKENITIEDKILEKKKNSLEEIQIVPKVVNQASSLS